MTCYSTVLFCLPLFFSFLFLHASDPEFSNNQRKALFATIQPTSLRKLLAFSSLYPNTEEGKRAMQQAWSIILSDTTYCTTSLPPDFEKISLALLRLTDSSSTPHDLSEEALSLIDKASKQLPNRNLKGHLATSLDDIEKIDSSEVDLARALVLLEHKTLPPQLTSVEASLDLLALEIIAKIGPNAENLAKIEALNSLVFHDLGIRFPPQNETGGHTNQFSELANVLSSRRGVCLGATVVYLSLAQRMGIPLTIYTPPGHIFVGFQEQSRVRVIETTARGVDIPLDYYLGLSLRSVPIRSMKEVVGLVLFNRAAGFLKSEKWDEAYSCYQMASRFETDEELQQMMSLCELLKGKRMVSRDRAKKQSSSLSKERLEHDVLLLDLADGSLTEDAAKLILKYSSPEGEEIPTAIKAVQKEFSLCPQSRVLAFHLSDLWLTYGKPKEALSLLEELTKRPELPFSVHAITASLHLQRLNIKSAWEQAQIALQKAQKTGVVPKQLHDFLLELQLQSPES